MKQITKILGPALMKPTTSSMGFWLAFGPGPFEDVKVEIKIEGSANLIKFQRLENSVYNVFITNVDRLNPGTKYRYEIFINGELLPNVTKEGYSFKTLSGVENSNRFALVSCHGVDTWEERITKEKASVGSTFNMWNVLAERVEKDDVDFVVLAGDQVYMDKAFEGKLANANSESIYDVYYKFWSDPAYLRVISRIPSFLMWDDHDLLDGFGSRNDQFNKSGKEEGIFSEYRKKLTQAFYEMQAVRNPSKIKFKVGEIQNFSTSVEVNGDHFHILDLRSERNSFQGILMGDDAWTQLEERTSRTKNGKRHFFVSPVTYFRMDEYTEGNIAEFANYLWNTLRWIEKLPGSRLIKALVWFSFFAMLFLSTQIPSKAGAHFGSSIVLFFLALFFLISEYFRNNKKNSKTVHKLMMFAGGIFGGLASAAILLNLMRENAWYSVGDYLQEFKSVIPNVFLDNWEVLAAALSLVVGGYVVSLLNKSKWPKLRAIVLALLALGTVAALAWTGFPDREPQWGHLINTVALLLSLFYLIVAFLESLNLLDEAAGIDDDVKDGWSSEVNRGELHKFLKLILDRKGKIIPYILSGDIHTGGLSMVSAKSKDSVVRIPQIVSSPITYEPMNHRAEMLTTTKEIREPQVGDLTMEAFNIFYRSERNFAIIDCGSRDGGIKVEFYFEDMVAQKMGPLGCQCGPKGIVGIGALREVTLLEQ
ncbi:alkaline phosphatase D family protein [Bdellovibrio sp. BCCA]|uniref:alkaline phosphatase D family protein n=1 Tax=Bdellovibrio sp. BCCA TaxID=3136281 RepID=UPI0030F29F23